MASVQQQRMLGKKGDMALGISTSGKSANINRALLAGREMGMLTVGFSGRDGGRMPEMCDWCFTVPSFSIHRIQETHETLLHDAPFVLVVEGSIPNEEIHNGDGYWAGLGTHPRTGESIRLTNWIKRLAPKAFAVVAAGTCASYGGIHAMAGNPTGAMGLADFLGWNFRSKAGLPIVNVPGCPVQPDNMTETLLYLLYEAAGRAPIIPLDDKLHPTWLFGKTVHEGCDRAGYYEQADFANEYGSPKCLVKIGC
jgi:NiFe hydrogenase small subunit HydA